MFKKLMGILTRRRANNQAAARVTRSVREVQTPLKDVSKVCHAIIKAREKGEDMAKALDLVIQWPAFTTSVQAVDTLIAPDVIDGKIEMLQRYPTIRKLAPQFLSTLVFRGHAVAATLAGAIRGRGSISYGQKDHTRQGTDLLCAEGLDASHTQRWKD